MISSSRLGDGYLVPKTEQRKNIGSLTRHESSLAARRGSLGNGRIPGVSEFAAEIVRRLPIAEIDMHTVCGKPQSCSVGKWEKTARFGVRRLLHSV